MINSQKENFHNFLKTVRLPDAEYTCMPFWFLNDTLKKRKIKKSLADIKSKGIDAVVIHPRIGFPKNIKYLSEKFFAWYGYILKVAKRNNLKVIVYDEAMYPSGSAGGLIAEMRPDLKVVGLYLTDKPEGKIISELNDGKYLIEKYSGARIRGLHFGEDDGEKNQPFAADILNEETVDLFIKLTHEQYYKRFSEYFESTIIGFFTDEPCPKGRCGGNCMAWTKGLDKEIVAKGGRLEELAGLFAGAENATTKIYHEIIKEKEVEIYYKKLHDFCAKAKISLIGHPAASDDIGKMKYFDVPGQDLIARFISRESGDIDGVNSVLGKCASDYALLNGNKRNVNECFGLCGRKDSSWDLPPDDIKWFIDYLAVRGVNMYIPHAFYYSLRGKRKSERPPDVGPNTFYWKHYKSFSTYYKRLSWIMTDITSLAKVAVICENKKMPYESVKYLYENQIDFRYVPVDFIGAGEKPDERLRNIKYFYDEFGLVGNFSALKGKSVKVLSEIKERDVCFENEQKYVRVRRFLKNGIECLMLVNSGEERVTDKVKINTDCDVIRYDIWNNEYGALPSEENNGCKEFLLTIERNESVLLMLVKNSGEKTLAEKKRAVDFCPKLIRNCKRKFYKVYKATVYGEDFQNGDYLGVNADEFVEWFVNGKLVQTTFWNPHLLSACGHLKKGRNEIKLRVVGSVADKYSKTALYYGIYDKKKITEISEGENDE